MNESRDVVNIITEGYWREKFTFQETNDVLSSFARSGTVKGVARHNSRASKEIPSVLISRIRELTNNSDILELTFYLSALNILLFRCSGESEILVGSSKIVEAVELPGDEHTVVFYKNHLQGSHSFKEVFTAVKEEVQNSVIHQNFGFTNLANRIVEGNERGFFKVGYWLEGVHETCARCEDFDWDVRIFRNTGASIQINFSGVSYDASLVNSFAENFVTVLEDICKNPYQPVGKLTVISPNERNEVVNIFNQTHCAYSQESTLLELFLQQVKRTPESCALVQNAAVLSYRILDEYSTNLAIHLLNAGVSARSNIGLMSDRSFDMVIGMLAIMKAGCAYVPIDPEYPPVRQEYIIKQSNIECVLADSLYDILDHNQETLKTLLIGSYQVMSDKIPVLATPHPGDLAYIIYTSGSTGNPKGVMIQHHSAVNLIEWVNRTFSVTSSDRILLLSSMCFDLSVYEIFGALAAGASLVLVKETQIKDPKLLAQLLKDQRITFWDSVPSTMNHLVQYLAIEEPDFYCQGLRVVFMSGDWIPTDIIAPIKKYFPKSVVIGLGGATEGTVWSNYFPIEEVDSEWKSIPYGKPLSNNFFYILDNDLQPVPKGVRGELFIGGVGVAAGYYGDDSKTSAAFLKDPFHTDLGGRMYRTGDMGRMRSDGAMEILGRKDFQVKIRGYRVEIGEIENALSSMGLLNEVVVVDKKHTDTSKYLVAYYTSAQAVETNRIKDHLKAILPDYMIPSFFVRMDQLPLNSNGKIDRMSLPDPTRSDFASSEGMRFPTTETEKIIKSIWSDVLKREDIAIDDNFFEVGGHSLYAIRIISLIYKKLNVKLNLRDIFVSPTISDLGRVVDSTTKKLFRDIDPIGLQEFYDASHAQKRLWIAAQKEDRQTSYNMANAYRIKGTLNVPVFCQCIALLVERHEILRTTFSFLDNKVVQRVHAPVNAFCTVPYTNAEAAGDPWSVARTIAEANATTPFDLSSDPLLRTHLVKVSDREFVFALCMHHIISDGWSMEIIYHEVMTSYRSLSQGMTNPLSPLPIQYKDYAFWHNEQLENEDNEEHKNFWNSILKHERPTLNLPLDFPRKKVKSPIGVNTSFEFSPELVRSLQELIQQQETSMFITLFSLVNVCLYAQTGQQDIILGVPVAGRNHPSLDNQLGFYVNTLALRTQPDATASFESYLATVKETILEAYKHQIYPFDLVIENLDLPMDSGRHPLFDVMIVHRKNVLRQSDDADIENLETDYFDDGFVNNPFDLTFTFHEDTSAIRLSLDYDASLYEKETIDLIIRQFMALSLQLCHNPSIVLNTIQIGSSSDVIATTSKWDISF
ncbi:hypothetical protein BH09BAC3_BH09BAC3_33920 [soil metagenome]